MLTAARILIVSRNSLRSGGTLFARRKKRVIADDVRGDKRSFSATTFVHA
jgi:hypothetical protein